ncbi:hypothetical protein B0H12DRAFT_1231675 [Mycena haematopus]|nr:hypothetical protein B0H12DRAFT_1231675 [Mycena haematopus]
MPPITSTKQATFPFRMPAEQPPPLFGAIENGRVTPKYVLAWVCDPTVFFRNLGRGELGKVNYRNYSGIVSNNSRAHPDFGLGLRPLPYLGTDGNFYLIVMFNDSDANHIARVRNLAQDPLIASARVSMGVDQDESLEKTLQWFRWPLNWMRADSDDSESEGSDESDEDSESE